LNSQEFWQALPVHKRRSKSFREAIEFTAAIVDREQRRRRKGMRVTGSSR
jgi:hypothetical protein